jgi:RNA polymerase-associated protein RTF1
MDQIQANDAASKAARLVEINRRNRSENFKNASELKPVNTELKAGDAGHDPFSRRWTRSTKSHFQTPVVERSSSRGNSVAAAEEGDKKGAEEAVSEKGKLVGTKAPADASASLYELHNFEVKVDLSKMLSLGSTPEERVFRGNLLRRQRQERTIGSRKVPDTDNNSHPFAISIEEYKRRRGMK